MPQRVVGIGDARREIGRIDGRVLKRLAQRPADLLSSLLLRAAIALRRNIVSTCTRDAAVPLLVVPDVGASAERQELAAARVGLAGLGSVLRALVARSRSRRGDSVSRDRRFLGHRRGVREGCDDHSTGQGERTEWSTALPTT